MDKYLDLIIHSKGNEKNVMNIIVHEIEYILQKIKCLKLKEQIFLFEGILYLFYKYNLFYSFDEKYHFAFSKYTLNYRFALIRKKEHKKKNKFKVYKSIINE